ncbi:flagellin N-terminal helical domain-containing protein [Aliirhizobium terrae]|uniref:flagellin N-terminal helical domain-containing protein n=1 Tax=Terrirhizobium terrae TaxID=2926709 RepID=UPI0025772525|nr:flagellin [Rhizobium sp. CC-CFT758]
MASILTNTNAMAALSTLRSISSDMATTQDRISSGLKVGSASDNAAYWSIATTMKSDNEALGAVQDAMGLGAAKIDTAYAGMESAIDVVKEIKNKLVTAQESSADKAKIQEEITQLQDQLKSITDASSFSGENWLKGQVGTAAADPEGENNLASPADIIKQVVGSFTRDGSGNVKVQTVEIELNGSNVLFDTSGNQMGLLDSRALQSNVGKLGDQYFTAVNELAEGAVEGENNVWSVGTGEDETFFKQVAEDKWVQVTDAAGTNAHADAGEAITSQDAIFADGTSISDFDISDMGALKTALNMGDEATDNDTLSQLLSHVDAQLEGMTSAAAALGAVSSRIEMQTEFVSKLSDSIDSGVGRLVDADMNEESTKLKALQTQQQLAIQALSIANSDSQNILSLFR